jgi:hypothetical protein
MHRIYEYLVFPLSAVLATFAPDSNKPDAYRDSDTAGVREAAQNGYRWIRTDGENAVFKNAVFEKATLHLAKKKR